MKAREYWIAHPYIDEKGKEHDFVYDEDPTWILENTGNKAIHVIEYLAYEELRRQNEVMLEALEDIASESHSSLCESMKPYRPNYACHVEIAEEALSKCGKGGSV